MFERSDQAPIGWAQHDTEAVVRDWVLESGADVVLFQELPGQVPFVETHDMIRSNPLSHSGNLATLVRRELMTPPPTFLVVERCALVVTFPSLDLTVANVHLSPSRAGEDERRAQLEAIVGASPTADLVILGDTNTRLEEVEPLCNDLGLLAPKPPKATWNSKRNLFRTKGHKFTAYFTRGFTSKQVELLDQAVLNEPVDHDGSRFHLSDHYPLIAVANQLDSAVADQ